MSMTTKKIFDSEYYAWTWVRRMLPNTRWYIDREASKRAGYTIYRDTKEFYNYVCELGDRVEVNLKVDN